MKKIFSLLLILALLLRLTACVGGGQQTQTEPQLEVSGTTQPLFWPPIPTGTEETEPLPGFTHQVEQDEQEDVPQQIRPTQKPQDDYDGATYYPRDDEDDTRPQDRPEQDSPDQGDPQPSEPETVPPTTAPKPTTPAKPALDPNGSYDSKNNVALFIVTYGRLPNNYITKRQAERLGWDGGSVERYAPGKCIGGDRFYNNEGRLPGGYPYYECDIGTLGGGSRGSRRLVFTYTGIVYYTSDHYNTFARLY